MTQHGSSIQDEILAFHREVLANGAEAALPRNFTDGWLRRLIRSMEEREAPALAIMAVLALLGAKPVLSSGRTVSREELALHLDRYYAELSAEASRRKKGYSKEGSMVENILETSCTQEKTHMNKTTSLSIAEFDIAIQAHAAWTRKLLRCSLTRTSPQKELASEKAAHLCHFGKWFAVNRNEFDMMDAQAAARLEKVHNMMHRAVICLCESMKAGEPSSNAALDSFESSQDEFISLLESFKTAFVGNLSCMDSLTGLPGRHGVPREFKRIEKDVSRFGGGCFVAMIDIDHFKRVNDTWGHSMGDLVLRRTARSLRTAIRGSDMLYRYGGEEFLALIRCTNDDQIWVAARRIVESVRSSEPLMSPDGTPIRVTVTVGMARVQPNESLERVIERADAALYAGKRAGRDRWVLSEEEVEAVA